jgi:SAM-dependent methyltransferase
MREIAQDSERTEHALGDATEPRGPRFRRFSRDVETFNAVTNRRIYETEAEIQSYRGRTVLTPDERVVLERLRDRWHEIDVLDVGVGAGRTAYTFGAIARRYVGIDYSPAMIELCRETISESDRRQLLVADARDLSPFEAGTFGFILFSNNGIDAVDPEERQVVLREFRRVLTDDGTVLLSAHSLDTLPMRGPRRLPSLRPPVGNILRSTKDFLRQARNAARYRRANRSLDLEAARRRGWGIARDPGHNFALAHYYVTAEAQIEQFREAGLEVTDVLDAHGAPVDPRSPGGDSSLSYVARPLS